MGRCQACGVEAPTKYVEYYQNIGMLVMRKMRSVKGNLCRKCAQRYFLKLTGSTLVTGWWGTISAVINPFLVINNTVRYLGCLGLAEPGSGAFPVQAGASAQDASNLSGLPSYRSDIAMRLRGGQTPAEVAKYIAPRAGVSVAVAQAYIETVK